MKAAQITQYGGKEVMRVADDAPRPQPGPDEVLVAVRAAGVNPFDWKVRAGDARQMRELDFPAILGGDCTGVVAEAGANVTKFQPGDEVYGQANALGGHGSFAEFTPVKAASLARKPQRASWLEAAALPLTAVSAYQALTDHMHLQAGQKILIHGGAGGIGSFAIQLAKHLGATVVTTAAPADADYVKQLGTDEVIDYTAQAFETIVRDCDAVYDTVGGETYAKSFQTLKRGGTIVSMLMQPDQALASQYGVTPVRQVTQVTTERLESVAKLYDEGALQVTIDKTFPLAQAADALDYLQHEHHRGKVVIQVQG